MTKTITLDSSRLGQSAGKDRAAIVFLCGAESKPTWGKFPEFIEMVPQLRDWDVFHLSLAVPFLPDAWGNWQKADLVALARLLGDYVQTCELKDYDSLAFLAHSLGGLVVQRMLLDAPAVAGRTGHLALFAVPSEGVAPPNTWIFWSRQSPDVLANSEFIGKLRSDWDGRFGAKPPFQVLTVAGYEDDAVSRTSAFSRFELPKLLGGTHRSLILPDDAQDLTVQTTVEALTRGAVPVDAANPRRVAVELRRCHALVERLWPPQAAPPNDLDDPTAAKLAKSLDCIGRRTDAIRMLERHHSTGTDAQGILGGLYKRQWFDNHLRSDAERALALYELGWKDAVLSNDPDQAYYHGINLVFMLMAFRGDIGAAMALAPKVLIQCRRAQRADSEMWCLATEGQALLTLGRTQEAVGKYQAAVTLNPEPWEFDSMRLHALRVAELARIGPDWIDLLRGIFG